MIMDCGCNDNGCVVATDVCPSCNNKGKSVRPTTIKHLIKSDVIKALPTLEEFFFCETPSCDVIYFHPLRNLIFYKKDVKVRVGIKETEPPIPLCYCFGWTKEKIAQEIEQFGKTKAIEEITTKVKAGECKCEITNPSGRCCLGTVRKVVKELLKSRSHEG